MPLKILLWQARHEDDPARMEERVSFAQRCRLELDQIVPHDLLNAPPTMAQAKQYDAVFIGGSGDYYVSKRNLPYFEATLDTLRELVAAGHPTFASCFGFHLMVEALGGEIIYDEDTMQVGTYPVALTQSGTDDVLFSSLPPRFPAQLGRKDRASRLPDGVLNLATNDDAPYQALRIPGKPIWATQFHPELTGKENQQRFHRYMQAYQKIMTPDALQETLDRFRESPEAEALLPRFMQLTFD